MSQLLLGDVSISNIPVSSLVDSLATTVSIDTYLQSSSAAIASFDLSDHLHDENFLASSVSPNNLFTAVLIWRKSSNEVVEGLDESQIKVECSFHISIWMNFKGNQCLQKGTFAFKCFVSKDFSCDLTQILWRPDCKRIVVNIPMIQEIIYIDLVWKWTPNFKNLSDDSSVHGLQMSDIFQYVPSILTDDVEPFPMAYMCNLKLQRYRRIQSSSINYCLLIDNGKVLLVIHNKSGLCKFDWDGNEISSEISSSTDLSADLIPSSHSIDINHPISLNISEVCNSKFRDNRQVIQSSYLQEFRTVVCLSHCGSLIFTRITRKPDALLVTPWIQFVSSQHSRTYRIVNFVIHHEMLFLLCIVTTDASSSSFTLVMTSIRLSHESSQWNFSSPQLIPLEHSCSPNIQLSGNLIVLSSRNLITIHAIENPQQPILQVSDVGIRSCWIALGALYYVLYVGKIKCISLIEKVNQCYLNIIYFNRSAGEFSIESVKSSTSRIIALPSRARTTLVTHRLVLASLNELSSHLITVFSDSFDENVSNSLCWIYNNRSRRWKQLDLSLRDVKSLFIVSNNEVKSMNSSQARSIISMSSTSCILTLTWLNESCIAVISIQDSKSYLEVFTREAINGKNYSLLPKIKVSVQLPSVFSTNSISVAVQQQSSRNFLVLVNNNFAAIAVSVVVSIDNEFVHQIAFGSVLTFDISEVPDVVLPIKCSTLVYSIKTTASEVGVLVLDAIGKCYYISDRQTSSISTTKTYTSIEFIRTSIELLNYFILNNSLAAKSYIFIPSLSRGLPCFKSEISQEYRLEGSNLFFSLIHFIASSYQQNEMDIDLEVLRYFIKCLDAIVHSALHLKVSFLEDLELWLTSYVCASLMKNKSSSRGISIVPLEYQILMTLLFRHSEGSLFMLVEVLSNVTRRVDPLHTQVLFPISVSFRPIDNLLDNFSGPSLISPSLLFDIALSKKLLYPSIRLLSLVCEFEGGTETEASIHRCIAMTLQLLSFLRREMNLNLWINTIDFLCRVLALVPVKASNPFLNLKSLEHGSPSKKFDSLETKLFSPSEEGKLIQGSFLCRNPFSSHVSAGGLNSSWSIISNIVSISGLSGFWADSPLSNTKTQSRIENTNTNADANAIKDKTCIPTRYQTYLNCEKSFQIDSIEANVLKYYITSQLQELLEAQMFLTAALLMFTFQTNKKAKQLFHFQDKEKHVIEYDDSSEVMKEISDVFYERKGIYRQFSLETLRNFCEKEAKLSFIHFDLPEVLKLQCLAPDSATSLMKSLVIAFKIFGRVDISIALCQNFLDIDISSLEL